MSGLKHKLYDYLILSGFTENSAKYLNMLALLIALLIAVFIIDYVTRKILVKTFAQFASVSKSNFDDLLVANKVPRNIAHIIPLLVAIRFVPEVFGGFSNF
ncbi:small-conductance mechanosensitive channel [Algibacter lectus]|uniref:Small-conductance mechanosensitive channel n=1 Tax=Algibacter lectus TaxID=221126 RepID=A0A090WL65_9FLAO|nr:small-conductance mechanosensitive channel [Algibacter lectus]